jgi:hypothetical protein
MCSFEQAHFALESEAPLTAAHQVTLLGSMGTPEWV